jgi:serine/threonine protein kinase
MTEQLEEQIGQFRIVERIGQGGQASVYLACDSRRPGVRRAIKVLHGVPAENEDGRRRFLDEAYLLQGLDHKHIVRVHGSGTAEDGRFFTVVDYVTRADGKPCNLREYVRDHAAGPVPPRLVRKWACQLAEALSFAHSRGVLHRDIKPSNLLLDESDDIKLVDFGLAKLWGKDVNDLNTLLRESVHPDSFRTIPAGVGSTNDGAENLSSGVMGSLEYMAPEQFKANKTVDHRADLYAVGVVLYRLLTGRMNGHIIELASEVVSGLDETWDRIIARCTKYNAADRYRSADELLEALREVEAGEPGKTEEPPERVSRQRARLEAVVEEDLAICREAIEAHRPREVRHYLASVSRTRASLWAMALQGRIPGAFWLVGKCCELGVQVEGPNLVLAWKWYNEAHRRGLRLASYTIATILQADPHPMNLRRAFEFYLISARDDDALRAGQFEVGTCYRFGLGVRRSRRQARKWLSRAHAAGFPDAATALRELRTGWRMMAAATALAVVLAIGASLALPAVYEPRFERRVARECKRLIPPHDAGAILQAGMSGLRLRREGLIERGRRADRLWRAYNAVGAVGQYLALREEIAEFRQDIDSILSARGVLSRADALYESGDFHAAVASVRRLAARTPDLESMLQDALEPLAESLIELRDPNRPLREIAERLEGLRVPTGYSREPADRWADFVNRLQEATQREPREAVAMLEALCEKRPADWERCPRAAYVLHLALARARAAEGRLDEAEAEIARAGQLDLGLGDDARDLSARLSLLSDAWSIGDETAAREMLDRLEDPSVPAAEAEDIAMCLRKALEARKHLGEGDYDRSSDAFEQARALSGRADNASRRVAGAFLSRLGHLLDPPDRLVLALGAGGASEPEPGGKEPVTMELRLIRVDRFGPGGDRPAHHYYLGATEVSQAQWEAMGMRNDSFRQAPDEPVVNVKWDQARDFCAKLATSARIMPAEGRDEGPDGAMGRRSWESLIEDGWQPTLPDMDEWWFAYQAGNPSFPDSPARLQAPDARTNIATNTYPRAVHAGLDGNLPYVKAWGLTAMAGNVREWCRLADDKRAAPQPPAVFPACGGSFLEATGAVNPRRTCRLPGDLAGGERLLRHRWDTGFRVCLRWPPR